MLNTPPVRVLIADDRYNVRMGLSVFFQVHRQFELVGEAANGLEAVEFCEKHKPDVVLMDISMPVMSGIQATKIIREKHPDIQVIGLSGFSEDKRVVQQMLRAGAAACVLKYISAEHLDQVIRDVL